MDEVQVLHICVPGIQVKRSLSYKVPRACPWVSTLKTYTGIQSRLSHLFPGWLVLFTLGHFSHHLLTALPVPLLPFMRDNLSLDYARSGLIFSVFSTLYSL